MLKLHLNQIVAIVLLSTFALFSIAQDSQSTESDILFLKIQELEMEIASLRNEVEAQNYLIEKLINESAKEEVDELVEVNELDSAIENEVYRFDGINDVKSIDEIYNEAVKSLANEDYDAAKKLFNYLINNFSDPDKFPLSLFWLAEIEFSSSNFDASKNYYMQLISSYEDHWRVPLAHKKIGDISFKLGNIKKAKEKYGFMFNTEFVPAENLGVKNSKWDTEDGLEVSRGCYNSYFYAVEDNEINTLDKIILHGNENIKYLDGGSALHLNLEEALCFVNEIK